jgi:hypothetical protein
MSFGNGQMAQLGILGGGAAAADYAGAEPSQIGGAVAIPLIASAPGIRGLLGRAMTPRGGGMQTVADYIRGRPARVGGVLGAMAAYNGAEDEPGYGY